VSGTVSPGPAEVAPADADRACEHARIRAAYRYYDSSAEEQRKRDEANPGVRRNADTRWAALLGALSALALPDGARLLDVGCGGGDDLARVGREFADLSPALHGADLLPDRIARAREAVPHGTFQVAGADRLPYPDQYFDVVLAATVFSSILDRGLARAVASEMTRLVTPAGAIVCYDTRYPNPWNSNTAAVSAREWRLLFPCARIRLMPETLLPPLARRLGPLTAAAYGPLRGVRFLRSHYVAEIRPAPPGGLSPRLR
jgi:ubiquinone/menaquinone biosynthesis C-methylase UbiE